MLARLRAADQDFNKQTIAKENIIALNEQRIKEFLGAFPDEFINLSGTEQRVSAQIYRLLAKGEPVPVAQLASTLDLPLSTVEEVVSQWAGFYYDDDKAIIGYWGLSLLPEMPHSFEVDGQTLYTWCAWDALFIPQIIGKTARVESTDPVTGEKIRITVSPEGIESVEPGTAVTSFMMPDTDEVRADVIKSFCHYLHFFSSEATAREWIGSSEKSADLIILSIEEGFKIGADKNDLQYKGDLLLDSSAAV